MGFFSLNKGYRGKPNSYKMRNLSLYYSTIINLNRNLTTRAGEANDRLFENGGTIHVNEKVKVRGA